MINNNAYPITYVSVHIFFCDSFSSFFIHSNKLYISSDDLDDEYILELIKGYPNIEIIKYDQIKTIQFASTCKYIILSTGSFSAIIGYLSFFSNVYYPKYNEKLYKWGDMLTIPGWNQIDE